MSKNLFYASLLDFYLLRIFDILWYIDPSHWTLLLSAHSIHFPCMCVSVSKRFSVIWIPVIMVWWCQCKEPACQCRRCKRHKFDPWLGKIPWRREWQPTPVILPGESHGQRSLVGYSPWGCKELDMTEQLTRLPLLLVLNELIPTTVLEEWVSDTSWQHCIQYTQIYYYIYNIHIYYIIIH